MINDDLEKQLQQIKELADKYHEAHGWVTEEIAEINQRLLGMPVLGCVQMDIGRFTLYWTCDTELCVVDLVDEHAKPPVLSLPVQDQKEIYPYIPKFLELIYEKIKEQL